MQQQPESLMLLKILKKVAGTAGPQLVLPIGNPVCAFLRVVATEKGYLKQSDVSLLTKWRNQYVTSFLSEFEANEKRTANWLMNVVGPSETKLLFMVDDLYGQTFGYMGIAFIDWEKCYCEADAVVRGGSAPAGTMSNALRVLLAWSREHLGLKNTGVRVRSDNPALAFYEKFGFIEEKRVPLKLLTETDGQVWVEDLGSTFAPVSLVYMRLS